MKIDRHYTLEHFTGAKEFLHIKESINWKTLSVLIKDSKGKILCDVPHLQVPENWTQAAADIFAHKYLRKTGVHPMGSYIREPQDGVPEWLLPVTSGTIKGPGSAETSAHQVFHRIAGHWTYAGWKQGYFSSEEDALAYYDEMYWMMAHQIAAPNSPQWFNTGIWWAYGIRGKSTDAWHSGEIGGFATPIEESYKYPQTSACFILNIRDSLLGQQGILDTIKTEAHIFKYGSGCGINYSPLRPAGSSLSNGGYSSGLMSFLKVFDANAGAIKSGGTTRRAARMVVVNADHPEAEAFVEWKAREELKVAAMALGATTAEKKKGSFEEGALGALTTDYESEAYQTVSGQNANNSLRVSDKFMEYVEDEGVEDEDRRKILWGKAMRAAWACGDPGIQFDDTCNSWHTIPKVGRQNATNPCSEFSFIDNSSCNLASLNLVKFLDGKSMDAASFEHAVRLWTVTLDLTIDMSSYPTKSVAENSSDYRPLGLGYANLGGLLMLLGVAYDSEDGRRYAATITSAMQAVAWGTSSMLAGELGAFRDFPDHMEDVKKVLVQHSIAHARLLTVVDDPVHALHELATGEWETWTNSVPLVRNAQLSLLAPTGTIGLVMDVATTGVEPDFSLVKHKKLAGGGNMKLVNPYVEESLIRLGYSTSDVSEIVKYISEFGTVDKLCPAIRREHVKVFGCAGDISWQGHIAMMIAVQPFLSGAISKTVNMPNTATVDDVSAAYMMAWKGGLKALAIYRDGCKLSQPLTAVKKDVVVANDGDGPLGRSDVTVAANGAGSANGVIRRGDLRSRGRYKLKAKRRGYTQKVRVGGHNLYLRTGEYDDGRLGEIFLTISREGSTLKHLLDAFAMAMSIGLQYGVPLQEFIDAFVDSKSEPSGLVQGSEQVRVCSSLLDFVVRQLDADYGNREFLPKPVVEEATAAEEQPVIQPAAATVPVPPVTPQLREVPKAVAQDVSEGPDELDEEETDLMDEPMEMPRLVAVGMRTLSAAAVHPEPLFKSAVRYTGEACPSCQAFTLRRNGSCFLCDSCGSTTGCS